MLKQFTPYKQVLSAWWLEVQGQYMDTTKNKKSMYINAYIVPHLGDYAIGKITKSDIQAFIQMGHEHGYNKKKLTGASLKDLSKVLKASFDWAVKQGYIKSNPCKGVRIPIDPVKEIVPFSENEVQRLIECARPKWFGDLILLAYRTGLRRGELYGLQWSDIDFKKKFLMVRRSIAATKRHERLVHIPKTKSSRRRVALDDITLDCLSRLKSKTSSEWVICNQYGKPISPWCTTKYMTDACRKAGIPHRSFHVLRHSHATFLLEHNVNPKIVQERLGHSKIATTLDTYSHVLPTMQHIVVDLLNSQDDD